MVTLLVSVRTKVVPFQLGTSPLMTLCLGSGLHFVTTEYTHIRDISSFQNKLIRHSDSFCMLFAFTKTIVFQCWV